MSLPNCKAVCREIEEADRGQSLSASAVSHVGGCEECQRFHDERLKLRQLVASLETVAAPADFDLRLRSRIANQRSGSGAGIWFNNFSFGIPSVALASLVLVVGGVFALKVWNASPTNIAVHDNTSKIDKPPQPAQSKLNSSEGAAAADKAVLATVNDGLEVLQRDVPRKKRRPMRSTIASVQNGGRLVTREFSSTPAQVIKQEETVASFDPVFSIETSAQPLRLSLDYSGGVSRTISVPALSFGSERVLSGGGSSLVKNSARGAW